jgi:ABC-2 type transport system ATP-binding protein
MNVPDPLLSVEQAVKRYGSVTALDGVELAVGAGELVALLGPNGAGKSTLMQLLTGLFVADAGRVRVGGFDMARQATTALARIGVVFQQPTLDLELTVRANLRFHADLHGIDRRAATERIAGELGRFGLAGVAGRRALELSGGNRRRVELARALLHRPDVLLMDEPTVGLDPASRALLLRHVLDLRSEGRVGVLWATHLVDEAERADRLVVLHRGRVAFNGTPAGFCASQAVADLAEAFFRLTADRAVVADASA